MEFEKVIKLKHDVKELSESLGVTPSRWKLCRDKLKSLHNNECLKISGALEEIWNDKNFSLEEHILITFTLATTVGVNNLLDELPSPISEMVRSIAHLEVEKK